MEEAVSGERSEGNAPCSFLGRTGGANDIEDGCSANSCTLEILHLTHVASLVFRADLKLFCPFLDALAAMLG
jgi:hypothetical protein